MKAIVIFNDGAGSVAAPDDPVTARALRDAFAAAGIVTDVRAARGPALASAFRDAIAQHPDALFAGGGDGTISAAAAHLIATGIPLGPLPLGTLNHFVRDLGLPGKWREAIPLLAASHPRAVDVAEVNGRIFINNCSLGSYAEAVRRRDRLRRENGHGKWRAMALAVWSVFRELHRRRFRLVTTGSTRVVHSPFLVVANNRYAGHVLDASLRPCIDERQLWLYSTRARGRGAVLRLLFQALIRPFHDADALDLFPATEVTIEVDPHPLPVAADGELLDVKPPLRFRIRPGALRVLAPSPKDASA